MTNKALFLYPCHAFKGLRLAVEKFGGALSNTFPHSISFLTSDPFLDAAMEGTASRLHCMKTADVGITTGRENIIKF